MYFIDGNKIGLRKITLEDLNGPYLKWMTDETITQYLESRFFPYSREQLGTYIKHLEQDSGTVFLAIIYKANNSHIGNIKLGPINWIHRRADIGILIGEKNYWGQGLGTEAISLISEYAFKKLNLHKLTASSYDINPGSVRIFEKAGFKQEAVLKQQFFCQGKFVDQICLANFQNS